MQEMIARRLGGIILCGGESRRMGRPKAWLPFAGEPLLCRVVREVARAAAPVLVVAAAGQELPAVGVPVVRDERPGRGPLEGLAAGLAALEADAAFVTACDAPFLTAELVRRLAARLGDATAVVPEVDGRCHPLPGVYRIAALPLVRALLAEGTLRLGALAERLHGRVVGVAELGEGAARALRNVNTPEDYEAAVREIG
jgi:molybdopterin-guanine dinucleotide biosynthesis protein A